MRIYLWIALGGAIGSVARYAASSLIGGWVGETFPVGTLAINILGSLVIGFFASVAGPDGRWFLPADIRLFVMVGLCGGFTTFSAFSLQTLALAQDGEWARAGLNVALSVALCLLAVWAGFAAGAVLNQVRGS